MINLNEEIDLVLEGSLLKEGLFLLKEDDRPRGPGQKAIKFMVKGIFNSEEIPDEEKYEIFVSMLKDLKEVNRDLERFWTEEDPAAKRKADPATTAGKAEKVIVDAMLDFIGKYSDKIGGLEPDVDDKLMSMIIGEPAEDQNSRLIRTKHIQSALWAIRYIEDAVSATKPGEEAPTGTDTGTDDEEETPTDPGRPEMSDEEKEKVAEMLHKASEILAIRALNTKDPGALVNKYGRLLRKYFIVYRAPKAARARTTESKSKETGIIEEMFLVEEPATAAPAAPAASGRPDAIARAGRGGERGADALLDAMTDEIEVPLEMAKKSLGEIEKAYEKYIEVHKRKLSDANYKARFMGMRYLMLRAAGREASGIKSEPSALQEGKLVNMVIDLEKLKSYQLDEGYLSMFGAWIEYFLNGLFGGWTPPVAVKGSQRDVEAFARALSGEKRYIETARRYGLDHPTTYKNKAKLDNAIKGFEGDTGIKWPFK